MALDIRTLDPIAFRQQLQSAAKYNKMITQEIPVESRTSDDEEEGYIDYGKQAQLLCYRRGARNKIERLQFS